MIRPWVKEELNASVVKSIECGSLLIPVLIDECEVPEALKYRLWSRISDLSDYSDEFERIVCAIFNRREKPHLAPPPQYTQVIVDEVPGLTEVDALIFVRACEIWLKDSTRRIEVAGLFKDMFALNIPESEFLESIEVMDKRGFLEGTRVFGGVIPYFRVNHFGFEEYLRRVFLGYDSIFDEVCLAILNEHLKDNMQLAERLNRPVSIINHIMDDLENRGFVRAASFLGGKKTIFDVYPEFRRLYRDR